MFAPLGPKTQTKPDGRLVAEPVLWPSTLTGRRSERDAAEHVHLPRSAISNPGSSSWNFGAIPMFSPEQFRRPQIAAVPARSNFVVQAKLIVGHTTDPLEHEADHVADQVMSIPDAADVSISGGPAQISRKCASCEAKDEEEVQRKTAGCRGAAGEAPAIVHEVLGSSGKPLDSGTRAFFEPRFGKTLSHIRVHTDSAAAASAREIGALAYTRGSHIVFDSGRYQTGTSTGLHLLAHELAHTVQQERGTSGFVQRANCRNYDESSAAECKKHPCTTRDGAKGKCKKTGEHVCECFPERMWRMMPDWLFAVLGAAALAAIAACFVTGVCEFAAAVAGLGALTAAAVIAVLKAAGIKDSKGA